jgi:hypothetical protein
VTHIVYAACREHLMNSITPQMGSFMRNPFPVGPAKGRKKLAEDSKQGLQY